jgi:hypothetical protein
MSINLHIERLILDGIYFRSASGPAIGAAVEEELGRLLREGGVGPSFRAGGAWANTPAGMVELGSSQPAQLGQQIALAVYQGIGKKEPATSKLENK